MKIHRKNTRKKKYQIPVDYRFVDGIEPGPDALVVFTELKVEGSCRVCKDRGYVHPYLRECYQCTQSEKRRRTHGWKD